MAGENHILVAGYDPSGHSIARPANRDNGPYQYDYGQVLRLEGFGDILPQTFEMHFSIGNGQSVTMIGNDGAVDFPDECLTKHGTVTAWLFLHDTNSDGETRYVIETTVKPRAKITNQEPTPVQQDVITQAIAALNNAVEETSGAVTEASEARDEAVEAAETATNQAAVAGRQALNAFNSAQNAATSAGQASGSASAAERSAASASSSATSANTSANNASASAGSAGQSADSAAQSAAAAQHSAENIENVVEVSPTEPTHEINKLWIVEESGTPVQVPTYAEHQALQSAIRRDTYSGNWYAYGDISYGQVLTSGASGQTKNSETNDTTDYIDVSDISVIVANFNSGGRYWFYNENKVGFETGTMQNKPELYYGSGIYCISVPAGAKYFRQTFKKDIPDTLYVTGLSDIYASNANASVFKGRFQDIFPSGNHALAEMNENGWYHIPNSTRSRITDLPDGVSGTSLLRVFRYSGELCWQILMDSTMKTWIRYGETSEWTTVENKSTLNGKTVAILGASNDTNGNPGTGDNSNAVEITVTEDDVGVELSAYLTYYDVNANLSLGGHTFTSEEIGTEVTFTPTVEDVGKVIGKANNYNSNSLNTWWEIAADELGFTPIPVCWSGASCSSHEATTANLKTAHAWHDAQIRKCGIRTPGTMTRTAPDVIIIARGLNDYGHTPYDVLNENIFDDFEYPDTDNLGNGRFGFYEALALTVKKLRTAYPKAQIVFCTMKMALRPVGGFAKFPPRNGTNTIVDFSEAIRKAANYLGCQLIEFDKCGITYENFLANYCVDITSTHPSHANQAGHNLMGERAIIDLLKLNAV